MNSKKAIEAAESSKKKFWDIIKDTSTVFSNISFDDKSINDLLSQKSLIESIADRCIRTAVFEKGRLAHEEFLDTIKEIDVILK